MKKIKLINKNLTQEYSSKFSIPIEIAQILANRFPKYSDAKEFLYPDITKLHDPKTIPDIEIATKEIIDSLDKNKAILIYTHDDPDGYTSAAIMYKTLIDLKRRKDGLVYVYPIIREKDGYILNPEVLRNYREKGVDLVVTVDFGISSQENFRIAKEENLRLIVCDHHETDQINFTVPAVNPKRNDSKYQFRELAGVGVAFKLAQSLYQRAFGLKPNEFYNLKKEFFSIALIGTISDRVILRDENRILCYHGLKNLNQLDAPWIRFFKKDGEINLTHITGKIIPIFASAANLDPNYGVGILISHDDNYIAEVVERLKFVNDERNQSIDMLFNEAISAAKTFPGIVISVIPFSKQHYLGSVASRLRDYFKRTSIVIGLREGKCFGELRSHGLHLYKMLNHFPKLFLDFGGHQKAAGFSMHRNNLDRFIDETVAYVSNYKEDKLKKHSNTDFKPEAFLKKSDIHILYPLAPFGEGNPAPILTDGVSTYTIDNRFNIRSIGSEG